MKIQDIQLLDYVGYLWYSNKELPTLVGVEADNALPTLIPEKHLSDFPFVVEGALYCHEKGISISIKNIDGQYHIHQTDTNKLNEQNCIKHKWLMAKDKNRKVKMWEVWEEKTDTHQLLAGMCTLRPAYWVFMGFEEKKD